MSLKLHHMLSEYNRCTAEEKQQYFEQLCQMDEAELRELFENSEFYAKLKSLTARKTNRTNTIGEAIKAVRLKRGLTQRELGLKLGYPENSTGVRVAQYESNARVPRPDIIAKMESILRCRFTTVQYIECSIEE